MTNNVQNALEMSVAALADVTPDGTYEVTIVDVQIKADKDYLTIMKGRIDAVTSIADPTEQPPATGTIIDDLLSFKDGSIGRQQSGAKLLKVIKANSRPSSTSGAEALQLCTGAKMTWTIHTDTVESGKSYRRIDWAAVKSPVVG